MLAGCGHDVLLVTRPTADRLPLPESIPPSTGKLFDVLGVRSAVDDADFVRSSGNTVWWGEGPARVETFQHGAHGWQVTADRLEPLLRQAAIDAGARVVLKRVSADEVDAVGGAFTLDCSGRTGVMARSRGLRRTTGAHPTVALASLWHMPFSIDADPSHTWIESYANGWAWSVPATTDRRYVSVMVDPRTSDLAHDRTARAVYLAELGKTRMFDSLTRRATFIDGPTGWDATMYCASQYVDGTLLLAGDAGSFIDPLSSIGVKKALASGWLAAVATHTALTRPAMQDAAFEFYNAREREIFATFEQLTTEYLAVAATSHPHPFWTDRGEVGQSRPAIDEQLVQAALQRMRLAQAVRFQPSPALRIEERPAVSGAEIVLERRVIADREPAGVRYLYDVDVLSLIELAPKYSDVPVLFETYNRGHAPVSLPDFLAALATVVAHRWLLISDQ